MSAGDVGFLYFIFYYTLVSNAKGNLVKSNKSELWNRLSYRGLPYHFEVRSQSFRNDCQISRSQPQNLEADFHSTSTTSKGLNENSKEMSWDNPIYYRIVQTAPIKAEMRKYLPNVFIYLFAG